MRTQTRVLSSCATPPPCPTLGCEMASTSTQASHTHRPIRLVEPNLQTAHLRSAVDQPERRGGGGGTTRDRHVVRMPAGGTWKWRGGTQHNARLKKKKRTSMLWWCMPHSWNQPAGSTSRTTSGPQRLLGWAMRCTHQQLWTPQGLCWHWVSAASLPVHFKSSSQIWPVPWPAKPRAITAPPVRPSCRHLHTGMRLGR